MSPDPPREDSGDDENRIRRFSGEFIEGIMDDQEFFIVPDAPYELDMEDESDYTDSDDELGAAGGAQSGPTPLDLSRVPRANGEERQSSDQELIVVEGQARGRYRLLIPFTVDSTSSASTLEEVPTDTVTDATLERSSNISITQVPVASTYEATCDHSSTEADAQKTSTSSNPGEDKREIEMNEEKVEKIMEVMKNITLPATAIPKWASEIDEDVWKRKLSDSIGGRSCNKSSLDKKDSSVERESQVSVDSKAASK